jgi:predicted Zn-dependent protease
MKHLHTIWLFLITATLGATAPCWADFSASHIPPEAIATPWPADNNAPSASPLPDLGDDVSNLVSPEQEYRLGRAWLRQLRGTTAAVADPLLQDYLEHLIYRLAFHSPLKNPDLTLIVIPDRTINAFAVPGGVVGINVGLLLNADTEAETASVLAHELGHLSQRHFARQLAAQKQNQWLYLGSMLATIALAAKGNSEGAYALGIGSQAALIDRQLSYNRQYEQEADRLGMQTLVDSNMDPHAMPLFFQKLLRDSRLVGNVPEFVLTHPLTESRIADTQNRASRYPQKLAQDSLSYQLIRVRLLANLLNDTSHNASFFQQQLASSAPHSEKAQINRLGYALTLLRDRHYKSAREALAPLLTLDPHRVDYIIAAADIELAERHYDDALTILQPALSLSPKNYPLMMYYARCQTLAGHPELAIERLEAAVKDRPEDPQIWRLLVDAYTAARDPLGVYRSKAEVFFLTGDTQRALEQLQLAIKQVNENYPLVSRIQKRIQEIQQSERDLKS